MKGSRYILSLREKIIECFYRIPGFLGDESDIAVLQNRAQGLLHPHIARVPCAHHKHIGFGRQDISYISGIQPMIFLTPPFSPHPAFDNLEITAVFLPVY